MASVLQLLWCSGFAGMMVMLMAPKRGGGRGRGGKDGGKEAKPTVADQADEVDAEAEEVDPAPKPKSKSKAKAKAKAETPKELPPIPKHDNMKMNQHLKGLAQKGFPQLWEEYSSCRTQSEKRHWYWNRYSADKGEAVLKSLQVESRLKETTMTDKAGLWTREEIAKAEGVPLEHPEFNQIMEEILAPLVSHPHHSQALAKRDIKLYEYVVRGRISTTSNKRQKREDLALTQQLSERQFAAAINNLDSEITGGAVGSKDCLDDNEEAAVTFEPHVETWQDALGKAQKVLQEANKRHSTIHIL